MLDFSEMMRDEYFSTSSSTVVCIASTVDSFVID